MGEAASRIDSVLSAQEIIDEMVGGAVKAIQGNAADLQGKAKL